MPIQRIFVFLLLVLAWVLPVKAQTDNCGTGVTTLTVNYTCVNTSYNITNGFTADAAASSCVTAANNREDGWYKFVAIATSTTITVTTNRNAIIAVYSSACGTAGTELGCVNAGACDATESLTIATTIGNTYYVRVIRHNESCALVGSGNGMTGNICLTSPAPIPSNDNCANATTLTVNTTCNATASTNLGATASGGTNPSCGSYSGSDVWFQFVASNPNLTITTSAGSLTDAAMSVYSGSCGSLTQIECDDDDGPGSMPVITRCDFVVGNTYYIRVWGYGGDVGTFNICVHNTGSASSATTNNCIGGTTVCNDAAFSGNSSGSGTQELSAANRGCLSTNEHQSSWYFFQATTGGTIQLNITPSNGTDDYDFAIWGPFTGGIPCPPCSDPLRCSYAAGGGTTGLVSGAGDNTEGAGGNKFVNAITATAGQQFVMVIDNYTSSSSPFSLDWTLTGGASLGCLVLPIELTRFEASNEGNRNKLVWETASETDNDFFTIEKSANGYDFTILAKVPGAGTSLMAHSYVLYDENPFATTYYRLKQVDFDGHGVYSPIEVVKLPTVNIPLEVFPVPATGTIHVVFSNEIPDNTIIRIFDMTGRQVSNQAANAAEGFDQSIDISHMEKGVYLLVAESKSLQKTSSMRKIVVE